MIARSATLIEVRTARRAVALLAWMSFGACSPCFADDDAVAALVSQRLSAAQALSDRSDPTGAVREARAAVEASSALSDAAWEWQATAPLYLSVYLTLSVQLTEAENMARRAIAVARAGNRADGAIVGRAFEQLGDIAQARGKLETALVDYQTWYRLERTLHPAGSLELQKIAAKFAAFAVTVPRLDLTREALAQITPYQSPENEFGIDAELIAGQIANEEERYDEAEERLNGAIEKLSLRDRPGTARFAARYRLMIVLSARGKTSAAARLLDDLISEHQSQNLPDTLEEANLYIQRANFEVMRGLYARADKDLKRAVGIAARSVDATHPIFGAIEHLYAGAHEYLGNIQAARQAYNQSVKILSGSLGPDSHTTLVVRVQQAIFEARLGSLELAQKLVTQNEKSLAGDRRRDRALFVGITEYASGLIATRKGADDRALQEMAAAVSLIESNLGRNVPILYRMYITLGTLQAAAAKYDAAETSYRRLEGFADANNFSAFRRAQIRLGRARLLQAMGKRAEALSLLRAASAEIREETLDKPYVLDADVLEGRAVRELYETLIGLEVPTDGPNTLSPAEVAETFEIAQYAQVSSVANAVAVAAARVVAAPEFRSTTVEEWSNDVEQLRLLNRTLDDAFRGTTGKRAAPADIRYVGGEIERLKSRLAALDGQMSAKYPDLLELLRPKARGVETVSKMLHPDEALILTFVGSQHIYVWCVTRTNSRVIRSTLDRRELDRLVTSVRRSIDVGPDLKNVPYDTSSAYSLYEHLLQPFEELLRPVKHLVYVSDGSLQSVPAAILLRKPAPASKGEPDYRHLDWVGRAFAISADPTVSSFAVLRSLGRSRPAGKPFSGFGNPDFSGIGHTRGITVRQLYRNGLRADPGVLRQLPALPETEAELKEMAAALGGDQADLYLGDRANVGAARRAHLEQFRVVAFATHAIVAGELNAMEEPAIILSPPRSPSDEDDGLLRASDVAAFKLNADWVILSACNTAAADGTLGAEGLSGLAQSFFLAGARALLVSNWEIRSDTTVLLTTGTVSRLVHDPSISKAEALRQSMMELVDGSEDVSYAHPGVWGPFVVVGDGAQGL